MNTNIRDLLAAFERAGVLFIQPRNGIFTGAIEDFNIMIQADQNDELGRATLSFPARGNPAANTLIEMITPDIIRDVNLSDQFSEFTQNGTPFRALDDGFEIRGFVLWVDERRNIIWQRISPSPDMSGSEV